MMKMVKLVLENDEVTGGGDNYMYGNSRGDGCGGDHGYNYCILKKVSKKSAFKWGKKLLHRRQMPMFVF